MIERWQFLLKSLLILTKMTMSVFLLPNPVTPPWKSTKSTSQFLSQNTKKTPRRCSQGLAQYPFLHQSSFMFPRKLLNHKPKKTAINHTPTGGAQCVALPHLGCFCQAEQKSAANHSFQSRLSESKRGCHKASLFDTPTGTRTPVLALRGLCPRPLDDGGLWGWPD